MKISAGLKLITDELLRAEKKFPAFPTDAVHAAAIIAEESGELIQAALQYTYEDGEKSHLREEAVQTGAMALRFLLHLEDLRSRTSEQVEHTAIQKQK